jgi:exosortase A-associated hydrolase 2
MQETINQKLKMERQVFFTSNNISLFGIMYQPDSTRNKNKGYLVIHPFAEEKKSSQRTLVELSDALCKAGFYVFMFDLRGCGDSTGHFKDATISDWLRDIHSALSFFKAEAQLYDVSLIGLRFGAYLATLYNYHIELKKMILIEPVFHPTDYLKKTLRQKMINELCTEGKISSKRDDLLEQLDEDISVDLDGYELSAGFYKDLVFHQGYCSPDILLKHITKSFLISISLTGSISKESAEFVRSNPNLPYTALKMELFWNKTEEFSVDKLTGEVLGYCLSDYYR